MRSYFRELISTDGEQSAGRFGFLFSIILSNIVVWYTWLFVCIWTRNLVDIPVGVYTAYGIANGVAFAGKGVQSFAERPSFNTQVNKRTSFQSVTKTTDDQIDDGSMKTKGEI